MSVVKSPPPLNKLPWTQRHVLILHGWLYVNWSHHNTALVSSLTVCPRSWCPVCPAGERPTSSAGAPPLLVDDSDSPPSPHRAGAADKRQRPEPICTTRYWLGVKKPSFNAPQFESAPEVHPYLWDVSTGWILLDPRGFITQVLG